MNRYLIVGLGNYPLYFANTRHNAGRSAVVKLCRELSVAWKPGHKQSQIAVFKQGQNQFYFLQPHCYMNDSGHTVLSNMNFYQIPLPNLVVLYDDLDVELGKVKIKINGSAGGHNGLQNIINCLQTDQFVRIRIGIKPVITSGIERKELVLTPFTADEGQQLKNSYRYVYRIIADWVYHHYSWDKILSLYQQKNTS